MHSREPAENIAAIPRDIWSAENATVVVKATLDVDISLYELRGRGIVAIDDYPATLPPGFREGGKLRS
jgi:hypothetical protein